MGIDTLGVYGYDFPDTIFSVPPGFGASARAYSRAQYLEQAIWVTYEGRTRTSSGLMRLHRKFWDTVAYLRGFVGGAMKWVGAKAHAFVMSLCFWCKKKTTPTTTTTLPLPGEDKKTGYPRIPQPWEAWKFTGHPHAYPKPQDMPRTQARHLWAQYRYTPFRIRGGYDLRVSGVMAGCFPSTNPRGRGYSTVSRAHFDSPRFRVFGGRNLAKKMKCGDDHYDRLRVSGMFDEYGLSRRRYKNRVERFFSAARSKTDHLEEPFKCGWDGLHKCPGADSGSHNRVAGALQNLGNWINSKVFWKDYAHSLSESSLNLGDTGGKITKVPSPYVTIVQTFLKTRTIPLKSVGGVLSATVPLPLEAML